MAWDRDDWLAAALIGIILIFGCFVSYYAMGLNQKEEYCEWSAVERAEYSAAEPEMPENQTETEQLEGYG